MALWEHNHERKQVYVKIHSTFFKDSKTYFCFGVFIFYDISSCFCSKTPRAERLFLRNQLNNYIMYLLLNRISDNGTQTVGSLSLYDSSNNVLLRFDTLELSYNNNAPGKSCVPAGMYVVNRKTSYRHGSCFELQNVLGRSNILIHKGNYNSDTKGCILIGNGFKDINQDFEVDVLNSKIAMNNLLRTLKTTTTIQIKNLWLPKKNV